MFKLRKLRCSFCRRNETEVSKLVAGPRVYICDRCVTVASRIMDSDPDAGDTQMKVEPTVWRRLTDWARRLFAIYERGRSVNAS